MDDSRKQFETFVRRLLMTVSILACASASLAHAQSENVGDGAIDSDEPISVEDLVTEFRSRKIGPDESRVIEVYADRYVIGDRTFSSLEELGKYLQDFPPDRFPIISLRDCAALARAQDAAAMKAELDHAYIRRMQAAGRTDNLLFEAGRSSPAECRWL